MAAHIEKELISGSLGGSSDEFRWYLCRSSRVGHWECKRTTKEAALSTTLKGDVAAIPVSKYVPTFCDPAVIHHTLHPRVRIIKNSQE